MSPAASMEHFPLAVDIVSRQIKRLAASVEIISDIEILGIDEKRISRPATDFDGAVLRIKGKIGHLNFAESLGDDGRTPHYCTVTEYAHADGLGDDKITVSVS